MATPAASASAWHRRRNVLVTPNPAVTRTTSATPLANPPQSLLRSARPSATVPQPQSLRQSPSKAGFSPALLLSNLIDPLVTYAETTLLRAAAITILTLILTRLLTRFFFPLGALLLRCRPIFPLHEYPTTLTLLRAFTIPPLTVTLLVAHFIFTKLQIRNTDAPTRIVNIISLATAAVPQAVLLNYATYGPSPPLNYLVESCTPSRARQLLPDLHDLSPQVTHAVFTCFAYTFVWHVSGARARLTFPFRLTPLRKAAMYIPRIALLSAIPVLVASVPAAFVSLLAAGDGYFAWVRSAGTLHASALCSFATLVSWNVLSVTSSSDAPSDTADEKERYVTLVQQSLSPATPAHKQDELRNSVIAALEGVTSSEAGLRAFPGFADASGQMWRATVAHALAPLAAVVEQLRAHARHRATPLTLLAGQTAPAPRLFAPEAVSPDDVEAAVSACRSLACVYVASYECDTYGVVHRTLPVALAALLKCKEATAGYLTEAGAWDLDWPGRETYERLRKAMQLSSDQERVAAVDDAVSLCVYRIVGPFRTHLFSYLEGAEVDWDRSVNGTLKAFLEYQVP